MEDYSIIYIISIHVLVLIIIILNKYYKRKDKNPWIEKIKEITPEEKRLFYQIATSQIDFLKNLQWNTMYYSLLLFSAIFGLSIAKIPKDIKYSIFLPTALFIFVFSTQLLYEYMLKMKENRIVFNLSENLYKKRLYYYSDDKKDYDIDVQENRSLVRDLGLVLPFFIILLAALILIEVTIFNGIPELSTIYP